MKRQINQRDIYYCDFGDNDGSEQSGERPSLIISNDLGNVNSDTIIVLPITSIIGFFVFGISLIF